PSTRDSDCSFPFSLIPRTPLSTLFPYTTLFRSRAGSRDRGCVARDRERWTRQGAGAGPDRRRRALGRARRRPGRVGALGPLRREDRKSTRLNSSHSQISYAVFCLKKKKQTQLHC